MNEKTLHESIIHRLLKNPEVKNRGFLRAMTSIIANENKLKKVDARKELYSTFRGCVCDAYHIDKFNSVVTWFEVEVGHPSSTQKLNQLAWANDFLQGYGWALKVVLFRTLYGKIFKWESDIEEFVPIYKTKQWHPAWPEKIRFVQTSMLREAA